MKRYIGAVDQGTTSTRFILFDGEGRIASVAQKEHQQIYPRPGWVEHNPDEIIARTGEVIAEALQRADVSAGDVAAVGITNQRETTVLWDKKTGKAVANAIVWQDTRVADDVAVFARNGGQNRFREQTGLPLSTYFSGLKLRWLLENIPGARARAEAGELLFGNIDTFLLWHLTGGANGGVHATDVTNASRTQLLNLKTLQWDKSLLEAFAIPASILPAVKSSSEVYGAISLPALKGVPIAGILGDQQAALVGQACYQPGEVKNTYGTGCFLLMNTGEKLVPSASGLLTTVAYKFGSGPAHYALEGSVAISGALVQWLRDNLGLIAKSADVEELAGSVSDNGDVYFVPAFSGLYAPYWKDSARGVIAGLTRYANKGHIARAVLEATAYQTRDVVEAMEKDAQIAFKGLRVDGGMVVNNLLMQFQADILDREVVRPVVQETTALGAAYAAGLAVGFYSGTDELKAKWKSDRVWKPAMAAAQRDRLYRGWKKAVTRSFDWTEN
ncbi:MAG TPA: glycerol kinase GlpK [Dongiaceae bacterium]|nr:glycerol kinase GlpK [Dongiaceae bacterium]